MQEDLALLIASGMTDSAPIRALVNLIEIQETEYERIIANNPIQMPLPRPKVDGEVL